MQPVPFDLEHEHLPTCWWDLDRARWTCPPVQPAVVALSAPEALTEPLLATV